MKILVANLGSTSFKYRLFDMAGERVLARGGVERIEFVAMGPERIRGLGAPGAVLFDVKRALPRATVDGCL